METVMSKLSTLRAAILVAAAMIGAGSTASAGPVFDLYNFGTNTGDVLYPQPFGTVVVGPNGKFYGAAPSGGANNLGGVFQITRTGVETVLSSFTTSNSPTCQPGVNLAGAYLIGTCYGVAGSGGTIYTQTLTTNTVLHAFAGAPNDGASPDGPPIKIGPICFDGTTAYGGQHNLGTIYQLCGTTETVLYSFTGGTDGSHPAGSLVQEIAGAGCTATSLCLVGTAEGAGGSGCGTVFQFAPPATFSLLHTFVCTDGSNPVAAMIQPQANGPLYGTTDTGGAHGDGVVFNVTPAGAFTLMHSFNGLGDGANPQAALVASNGKLFGTCINGGRLGGWLSKGQGTIFSITPSNGFTTLYRFNGSVGSNPAGGLVVSNNVLYGDTVVGGTNNEGVFYGMKVP
jgi:uncharacterized repeat protein (TIGR03803 family)